MKYFSHFRIAAYLVCCALLLAASSLADAVSQSQAQETDGHEAPSTSVGGAAPSIVLAKVCTAMNPPPCATRPIPVFSPEPDYSSQARKAKLQGTCTLMIVVSADGRPTNIRVVSSLGMGLDEKAIDAVKRWKFKPALQDGKPVAVQMAIEISFRFYEGGAH